MPARLKCWPRAFVIGLLVMYCAIFMIRAQSWYPESLISIVQGAQQGTMNFIKRALRTTGLPEGGECVAGAYFLIIAAVVPLIAALLMGRRLRDLGCRLGNRYALRYFVLGFVISLPFLIWMVQSPTLAGPYLKQLNRIGAVGFCGFYLINMLTEHFLLHGVVLGLCTPCGRWPEVDAPQQTERRLIGLLRWLGLSGAGSKSGSMSGWLGLPPGCLLPIVVSALLFGGVHLGKDVRELVLSFPGGLAQGYIAFRSGTWFTPFALHLATASAALGMMLWFR